MRELALNVLDIVENSLAAGAKLVKVALTVRLCDDFLSICIEDDGCGMDETTLAKAYDAKRGIGAAALPFVGRERGRRRFHRIEKGRGHKG